MAFNFSFDGPLVVITLSGTLEHADLIGIGAAIIALEAGGANTPPRLVDFRGITDAAVGYVEMARITELATTRPLNANIRSALLVSQPVQLGYARMFQILNEHPQVTVRIFQDEATARAWLEPGSPDVDTDDGEAS